MQARRLAKRSSLGGRRGGPALPPPGPAPEGGRPPPPRSAGPGLPRAAGAALSPALLLLGGEDEEEEGAGRRRGRGRPPERPHGGAEDGDEDEEEEEEEDGDEDEDGEERFPPPGPGRSVPRGLARGAGKVGSIKRDMTFTFHLEDLKRDSSKKLSHQPWFPLAMEEDGKAADSRPAPRAPDHDRDSARSVCLLEQKRKVVSSSIDVPPARKSSEELDMDKVTAAMVLTSLSTSPLVRSPPVRPNEGMSGSWKEGGAASSSCSSGYWSWSAPSDQSNPSTPSPPLSADCAKPFRSPAPDDGIDEAEAGSLLFDEPIPRKRKNSMKVMFKCLWKNCGKVLSTAAGIQKHIRGVHLGRAGESDYSDGEEDFYYTEIKLHTDAVADGLGGLAPASPSQSLASPPTFPIPDSSRTESPGAKAETKLMTPLSRSAPTTLYLVHTDHAYQATPPVTIPGSAKFTPNGSSFSVSWQSPPVTFTGIPVSPTHHPAGGPGEQRQHGPAALSSPPRVTVSLRKPRGEGKKCRKVYGMENRDLWCTACRWKKACQRFLD
ncbi:zinc finger protein 704 isoform X2 [Pipistrellus kuhlii]|uniref:Zinc finger protein 704 n=1 Tax=Pipistrellus kuhlii TaxID=59472 RepID=A0A7J7VNX1_PIPKU|nr:zinc finger protein 704 isoform X2 [Pipistrellus kuhlii]KAF6326849.1 zinc finger protein 704 [Pipistrellus kuhlii]